MSRKISLFSLFSLMICFAVGSPSLALAAGVGKTVGYYQVVGVSDLYATVAGQKYPGGGCPFERKDLEKFQSSSSAAKSGGDPDGCPFIKDAGDNKVYFESCRGVYEYYGKKWASVQSPEWNRTLMCCHESAEVGPSGTSPRQDCIARSMGAKENVDADHASWLIKRRIVPEDPNQVSAEEVSKINEEKNKEKEAKRQCFDGTMQKIGQYWAQKSGVKCVVTVTRMVKNIIKDKGKELKAQLQEKISTAASSTGVYGAVTAVISTPSIWGAINAAFSIASFAAEIISTANDAKSLLNTLNNDCGNIVHQLQDIAEWQKNVLGRTCQAAESLVERHLTQCARVNIGISGGLKMPQFNVVLQCPVTVDLNATYSTASGFDISCNRSVNQPVQANYNGRSLLSENGGLDNLFSSDCFKKDNSTANNGAGSNPTGTRMPGVDCGDLDPAKTASIQGVKALAPGRGVTNGWAVGGSETVNGQAVTRCDFYMSGRKSRTTYVFGSGSSCNAGAGGFMNGSFEANASCYPGGGYTPVAAPSAPDSCLYGAACLDANTGKLNSGAVGTAACSGVNSVPVFDPQRQYKGDDGSMRSCGDFDPTLLEPVMCCDPSKEDCTTKDANTPICSCDEGDATNVVSNSQTGQCEQGGNKTCCSPRLNGGTAGCQTQEMLAKGLEICSDEINQCVGVNSMGSYTGPDGNKTSYPSTTLASSKPSPYLYLFIRPDAEMAGQQCCTTEWCNICPQHYANAYGLSLVRSETVVPANATDAWNNSLIGKGWPFQELTTEDETGGLSTTKYVFGKDVVLNWTTSKDVPNALFGGLGKSTIHKDHSLTGDKMPLQFNENMKMPVSLTNCERATGIMTAKKSSEQLQSGMGFVDNGKIGLVPEPMEYPLDRLNRLRLSITDSTGIPLQAIPMCSEVKLCLPESAGSVLPPTGGSTLDRTRNGTTFTATTSSSTTVTAPDGTVTVVPSATNSTSSTNTGVAGGSSTSGGISSGSSVNTGNSTTTQTPVVTQSTSGSTPSSSGGATSVPSAGSNTSNTSTNSGGAAGGLY